MRMKANTMRPARVWIFEYMIGTSRCNFGITGRALLIGCCERGPLRSYGQIYPYMEIDKIQVIDQLNTRLLIVLKQRSQTVTCVSRLTISRFSSPVNSITPYTCSYISISKLYIIINRSIKEKKKNLLYNFFKFFFGCSITLSARRILDFKKLL